MPPNCFKNFLVSHFVLVAWTAAALALVDESGCALLSESDVDAVRAASFLPIIRVFSLGLSLRDKNVPIETAKKN